MLFHLSGRQRLHLVIESLLCPPFALNLIRCVSSALAIDADLVQSARRLQKSADWQKSCSGFIFRLEEEVCHEVEENALARALRSFGAGVMPSVLSS